MIWRYRATEIGKIEGTIIPLIENKWENDEGNTIIAIPSIQYWKFIYDGHGVSTKFVACSENYKPGRPIGPECLVIFDDRNIKEFDGRIKKLIKEDIISFFQYIGLSPLMQGESVTKVEFSKSAQALLGIGG